MLNHILFSCKVVGKLLMLQLNPDSHSFTALEAKAVQARATLQVVWPRNVITSSLNCQHSFASLCFPCRPLQWGKAVPCSAWGLQAALAQQHCLRATLAPGGFESRNWASDWKPSQVARQNLRSGFNLSVCDCLRVYRYFVHFLFFRRIGKNKFLNLHSFRLTSFLKVFL